MMIRHSPLALACALAALLSACGGSGGGSGPLPTQSASPSPAPPAPNVQFVMQIPALSSASTASKHAMDFTASTQSVAIAIGTQVLKTADVSTASSLCAAAQGGGRTCTVGVTAPTGNDQFTITAYDQANAGGNVIGQATVSQTVSTTPATVKVSVTGTIVKIAVSLSNPYPPVGTAATTNVIVTAYDLDGSVVLGPYTSPVSLQDSDTSGATSLSATTVTSGSSPVTLNYTGAKPFLSATITASLSGAGSASATFAPVPGVLNTYTVPTVSFGRSSGYPGIWNIAKGSDGNMWVVATGYAEVLKVAPDGTMTSYPLASHSAQPHGIVVGSDGNLWFAEQGNNAIGKITTAGVITEYTLPHTIVALPTCVGLGPDGNVWFYDAFSHKLGNVTPGGTVTEYPLPSTSALSAITSGPDGNLWLADVGQNAMLKVSTSGQVLATYAFPVALTQPQGLAVGPDGNIWIAEYGRSKIGRITPSGTLTEFATPTGGSNPIAITAGPDGRMWFAELSSFAGQGKIGYISVDGKQVRDFFYDGYHVHDLAFDSNGTLWYLGLKALAPSGIQYVGTFAY
jgi:streptogramin lyase